MVDVSNFRTDYWFYKKTRTELPRSPLFYQRILMCRHGEIGFGFCSNTNWLRLFVFGVRPKVLAVMMVKPFCDLGCPLKTDGCTTSQNNYIKRLLLVLLLWLPIRKLKNVRDLKLNDVRPLT